VPPAAPQGEAIPTGEAGVVALEAPRAPRFELPVLGFLRANPSSPAPDRFTSWKTASSEKRDADTERNYEIIIRVMHIT